MIHLRLIIIITFFCPLLLNAQAEVGEKAKEEARFIDGSTQLILENYEEAKNIFQSLHKADKNNSAICFQLSRSLNGLKLKREALDFARKTVTLDATNPYYFEYLIDLLLEEGQLEDAKVYAEQLYLIEPSKDSYFNNWMSILNAIEDYQGILDALDQKIKTQGSTHDLLLKKAGMYLRLNKPKKAEESLSLAEQKYPKEPEVGIQYIAFLFSQGKDSKAEEKVDQFLLRFPAKKGALMEIPSVKNYLIPESESQSNPILLIVEASNLDLDQKIKTLIPYLTKLANGAESRLTNNFLEALPKLESQHPQEAKVYAISGDVYFFAEQYDKAVQAYENCLSLKKNILPVWDNLLYAQYQLGNKQTMLTQAENALDYFPNQALIWHYYCLALLTNHRYEDAIYELDSYSFLIQTDKFQQFNAYTIKCQALFELGQYQKAQEALNMAKQLNPDDALVRIMDLRLDAQDLSSIKEVKKSLEQNTELKNHPTYILALADVLIADKQYDEAELRLKEALNEKRNNNSLLLEKLADALALKGDKNQAMEIYQDALNQGGYKTRIQSKLNKLN